MTLHLPTRWRRTAAVLITAAAVAGGSVTLLADPAAAAPTNDDLAAATTLTLGTKVSGTLAAATLQTAAGETLPSCAVTTPGPDKSVWYRFTAQTAAQLSVTTSATPDDGGGNTVVGVWSGPAAGPTFPLTAVTCDDNGGPDRFSQPRFATVVGTTYYIQVLPSSTSSADAQPFQIVLAPYRDSTTKLTGSSAGGNVTLTATVTAPAGAAPAGSVIFFDPQDLATAVDVVLSGGSASTTYTDIPNGPHSYRAIFDTSVDGLGESFGTVDLVATGGPVPGNDNLAAATPLSLSTVVDGTTLNATFQTNEVRPTCSNGATPPTSSVWYRFTPTVPGRVAASTGPAPTAAADTVVEVYSGPAGNPSFPLSAITCNDDRGQSRPYSRAPFDAVVGTTYYIQVTSFSPTLRVGPFRIEVTPYVVSSTRVAASASGTTVSLTATVTVPGGTPVGQVTFLDDDTTTGAFAPVTVTDGVATTTVTASPGTHSYSARFATEADGVGDSMAITPVQLTVTADPATTAPPTTTPPTTAPPTTAPPTTAPPTTAPPTTAPPTTAPPTTVPPTTAAPSGTPTATSTPTSTATSTATATATSTATATATATATGTTTPSPTPTPSPTVTPAPAPLTSATDVTAPAKVRKGKKAKVTVKVSTPSGPASGTVVLTVQGKVVGSAQLVSGQAVFSVKIKKKTTIMAAFVPAAGTLSSLDTASVKVKKPKKPKKR